MTHTAKSRIFAAATVALILCSQVASAAIPTHARAFDDELVVDPSQQATQDDNVELAGWIYQPVCYWSYVWGPYGYYYSWVCY